MKRLIAILLSATVLLPALAQPPTDDSGLEDRKIIRKYTPSNQWINQQVNAIQAGPYCVPEGESCIPRGKPCCNKSNTCTGMFPNLTCQ